MIDIVATSSSYVRMEKKVGIKELKNNLSAYLRKVKQGVRILITDRDNIVAELSAHQEDNEMSKEKLRNDWIKKGHLRPGKGNKIKFERTGVKLPKGTVKKLIDLDRGENH